MYIKNKNVYYVDYGVGELISLRNTIKILDNFDCDDICCKDCMFNNVDDECLIENTSNNLDSILNKLNKPW